MKAIQTSMQMMIMFKNKKQPTAFYVYMPDERGYLRTSNIKILLYDRRDR